MAAKPTYEELAQKIRDLELAAERHSDLAQTFHLQSQILSSIKDTIVIITPQMKTIYANQTAKEVFGDRPEMFTEPCYRFYKKRVNACDSCPVLRTIQDEKPHMAITKSYGKNGEEMWRYSTAFPFYDEDGKVVAGIEVVTDYTSQKKTEITLRESEEKYRTVLEANPDPVAVYDMEGRVVYLNPAFTRVFGWSLEEQIGKRIDHFVPEENWTETRMMINKVTVSGESFSGIETRRYTREGDILDVSISGSCYRDHEGKVAASVINLRNITEQKRLEYQLQKARKMEAMGLMAGGVAHDLNNILSGIVSYPDLLLLNLPEESPLKRPIETIKEAGMRAAAIVEDLMTIAKGVASGKEVLNLNTVVAEYLESVEHQKLERTYPFVHFKHELDDNLLNMGGSPIHIKKILMNLVANASEAIERSGKVTISTMNHYLDQPLKAYEDVRMGEYVVIRVSDDGSGIAPEDLERIFEPFYTKNVMGRRRGTGLGLAVVWNSVQDHNGYINVESREKGTLFELYFPVTRKEAVAKGEAVQLENYLGHGEKILVVDDEKRQREIACGMLTRLGYAAEAVSSGEKAIEYVKGRPVDLIVLDMVMPKGINGRQTYEEIIKIRPGQKTIIASGWAKTKEIDSAQALGAGKYIKKPYTMEKLGFAVKEELVKQTVTGIDRQ